MEAILSLMGPENSKHTQLAWRLTRRHAERTQIKTREVLLERLRSDQTTDVYSSDEEVAAMMLAGENREYDESEIQNLARLFKIVRTRNEPPDFLTICSETGCSPRNVRLKDIYWWACDCYLKTMYGPAAPHGAVRAT